MTDELAPLFEGRPDGPSLDQRYRQGTILSFDAVTLENTVDVGGSVFTNLPLLGVGEATLLVPGAAVGLTVIGGPSKTMYIVGRIVIPNTDDAADAVALLNGQVYSDQVITTETCSSTSGFSDLATVGPRVVVPIGASGRMLVIASMQLNTAQGFGTTIANRGDMGVELSGANTLAPTILDALLPLETRTIEVTAGTIAFAEAVTITGQAVYGGLVPGETTVTMKYRRSSTLTVPDPDFGRRVLTVIKL